MTARPLAPTLATAALLVACASSSKVSLGDDGTGLRAIDPDRVVVAVVTCSAGFAHATVCCAGASCTTRDGAPFYPCGAGETAYPDGTRCCALSDPTQCTPCDTRTGLCGVVASATTTVPALPLITGRCDHCPPGYTGAGETTTGCCRSDANGSVCAGVARCVGSGCPAQTPCAPSCAQGFVLTPPQVDVCCRAGAARPDCYVWVPADVNGLSCGGNGTSCACQRAIDGRSYQMDCDESALRCTCSVDGAVTASVPIRGGACQSSDAQSATWASTCAFPP